MKINPLQSLKTSCGATAGQKGVKSTCMILNGKDDRPISVFRLHRRKRNFLQGSNQLLLFLCLSSIQ